MDEPFNVTAEEVAERAAILWSMAQSILNGHIEAQHTPAGDFKFRLTAAGVKYVEALGN